MFVVGIDCDSRAYFGCITLFIGVPTAIKIFNWVYSFLWSDLLFMFEVFYVFLFIIMFLCGGVSGLILANVGLDVLLHDTYFVVAHFHYVLSLGAVVGVFGGFLHFFCDWCPLEVCFCFLFILFLCLCLGSNFLFVPLHSVGLFAFPRRISDFYVSYLSYTLLCTGGLFFILVFCFVLIGFFLVILCFLFVYFGYLFCLY